MANLTKEEIIKRGYLTDVDIANSNLDVDHPRFKAAITDRFYYDIIYGECTVSKAEESIQVQEPVTVVEEVVEAQDVVETSTESVLLEEDLKEDVEEVVESTTEEIVDPVEPEATVESVEEVITPSKSKK